MKKVVHCKKSQYDVYIGRPSRWGNPFVMGKDGTRDDVIAKFKTWLWEQINQNKIELADLADLDGKILACWCSPEACHGDVLVSAAAWAKQQLNKQEP